MVSQSLVVLFFSSADHSDSLCLTSTSSYYNLNSLHKSDLSICVFLTNTCACWIIRVPCHHWPRPTILLFSLFQPQLSFDLPLLHLLSTPSRSFFLETTTIKKKEGLVHGSCVFVVISPRDRKEPSPSKLAFTLLNSPAPVLIKQCVSPAPSPWP